MTNPLFPNRASHASFSTRTAVALLLCILMAACALVATGCRDSDAMKEIIFDQNAEIIDYDNPHKHYINDSTATVESNAVSSLEVSDENPESDEVQNLIVYSSNPNSEGFTAKKSAFSPDPDFKGIEASESVFFFLSDSVDAIKHAVTPVPEEVPEQTEETENENPVEQPQQNSSSNNQATTTNTNAGTNTAGGGATTNTTPDQNGAGAGGQDQIEESGGSGGFTSTEGIGEDKSPTMAFNVADRDADIPQVESIAAFGQYAVAIQMIGGNGALGATDAATLSQMQAAGVNVSAVSAWPDASGDPLQIDVAAIVSSGVKAIVVEDPNAYCRDLSTERFDYLQQNGVQWISLRNFCTTANIKANIETIGTMLQGSAKAEHSAQAAARASEYISRHDQHIANANGGLAQDDVNGARTLQGDENADGLGASGNTAKYTVLIDAWDAGAGCTSGEYTSAAGCAYASAGYSTTPVSFYIQAGGAINNAAALCSRFDAGQIPVVQFARTDSWNETMWWGTSRGDILYGKATLLDSGVNRANNTTLGEGLGSAAMPKIIVTSGEIKNNLLANSADANGIYHAYGYVGTDTVYGAVGFLSNPSAAPLWSCIGSDASSGEVGSPNPIYSSGVINADDVLVNPSGLFCDWTQGTVESFLEAGWVGAALNGSYDYGQWESDVVDFYSWAYGISPNMSQITNR